MTADPPPTPAPSSVVVVGCGIAGLTVCDELRSRGFGGAVTVVDAEPVPYDRPPLSKAYLLGTASAEDIALAPAEWFAERELTPRFGVAVRRLLPGRGVELTGGEEVAGDVVVLATGAAARQLPFVNPAPGVAEARLPPAPGRRDSSAAGALLLRDRSDADVLRRRLLPGSRIVVVGGGLIGSEVASAAVAAGARVTLVEPLDPPLVRAFGQPLAELLHAQHGKHGVAVVPGVVTALEPSAGGQVAVAISGRSGPVVADTVVAGIGVRPRAGLAAEAGLEVGGGVLVDAAGRTSVPGVFAVGDVAARRAPAGLPVAGEHWDAALRSGRVAAAAILGQAPPPVTAPWFWSDRYGWHVEVAGELRGPTTVVRGSLGTPPFSIFSVDAEGRLVGVGSVDDPRAVRAGRRLIDAGTVVDEAALRDPGVDLRRLR